MIAATTESSRFGEDKSLAYYFKEVDRHPQISAAQERVLAERVDAGDGRAVEELVNANLRFVIHVAKGFQNQGLPLADLINEGNCGLLTAARKFRREKNCKFITYAVWWIRQNILKALEVQTRPIRVPANVLNDLSRLRKVEDDLAKDLEREPTTQEIAEEVVLPPEKVTHTLGAVANTVSLDSTLFEDQGEVSLGDTLPDPQAVSPDEDYFAKSRGLDVADALGELSSRHQEILNLYFGMEDGNPSTYQQIGSRLGISRERVRQLKEDAFTKLRQPSLSKRLTPYL